MQYQSGNDSCKSTDNARHDSHTSHLGLPPRSCYPSPSCGACPAPGAVAERHCGSLPTVAARPRVRCPLGGTAGQRCTRTFCPSRAPAHRVPHRTERGASASGSHGPPAGLTPVACAGSCLAARHKRAFPLHPDGRPPRGVPRHAHQAAVTPTDPRPGYRDDCTRPGG